MTRNDSDSVYYDPFDAEIDTDPHPVWRRLRDEAPIYHNEKYGFYALSRFDDVEKALNDWDTYRSGKGSVLEFIMANVDVPPGMILFEDPPIHDVHRGLLSRVFTPKKMNAIEPQIRQFCARTLEPLMGEGGFDFILDLGGVMPMLTIGMLLGIPEQEQETIRHHLRQSRVTDAGSEVLSTDALGTSTEIFADYLDWRTRHPSDDLMTELINVEFDDDGKRRLTREEILGYVMLLIGAGSDTTTRLIGWTGKLLAEHKDQRRDLVADRTLVPKAIEEILRYEAPSPVQARTLKRDVEHYGQKISVGSIVLLLNGSANRDERHFPDSERFDIYRQQGHHVSFGYGLHFCLGAALARLEGRIALDEVLQRFPNWEVDWGNAKQAHSSTTRGWERLPVFTT